LKQINVSLSMWLQPSTNKNHRVQHAVRLMMEGKAIARKSVMAKLCMGELRCDECMGGLRCGECMGGLRCGECGRIEVW
jgi:hypothetical protein